MKMRQFILVACLAIASVSAKPGSGYSYNIPAGGGLAANLLPPTSTVSQQFAPSHGSLGLSHNSNGASLALGTSYSAASPQHSFHGHSQGGLLASHVPSPSYGPPIQHVASPSFTPSIAIVAPAPNPSYGAPPSPSFSVPAPSQSYGAPSSSSFSVSAPSPSYGAPSSSSFSVSAPSSSYGAPSSPSFSVVGPAPSSHSSYVAPASGPVSVSAPVPSFSVVAPAPSSQSSFSVGSAPSSSFSDSSFGSAPSSSFNSFSSAAPSAGAQQTIIQKHIYVHVPPPDVEEQQSINLAPQAVSHQKHYKIIFIKAPSAPSIQEQLIKQQIAQQQQVNEEKTLVYVLVKKPEGLQELRQAQAAQAIQAQTVQNKPEVYFIKYKAEKGGSPSLGSLVGNLPSSISSGNVDLSGLGSSLFSSASGSSIISSSSGHTGGKTYLPPVENPPPSAISSGEGSSLSSSSVSEIIQPRTPAPEYGPPNH